MDCKVLDELMSIKKKSDASREKRQSYENQLVELLKEEGFSQKSEEYIKDGFSFSGAEPIMRYLESISTPEEKRKRYMWLFDSKLFRENERGIAFKLAIHMLALELKKDSPDDKMIEKLIRTIPVKVMGKEGDQLKDSSKIVEKYFLKEIVGLDQIKNLYSFNIERGYITSFKNLIVTNVTTTKTFQNLSEEEKERFLSWLEGKRDSDLYQKSDGQTDQEKKDPDEKNLNSSFVEKKEASIDSIIEQLESFKISFEASKRRELELEKTAEKGRSIIDSLHNEIENKKRIIDNLNKKLEEQNAAMNQLESQVFQLRKQLNQQIEDNEKLQTEIERIDTVNSVYAADKESSKNEQLNAIASKLKAEFVDFKDAENMEMDLDLGENFRCQLQSVFRILKKEGIDVEGR